MMSCRTDIRILGCGNLLMGDDGVGIHIIEELKRMHPYQPGGVEIVDAGTCGLDILNFLEGPKKVIIVDAVATGARVGSIHRFSANELKNHQSQGIFFIHDLGVLDALCVGEHVQDMPDDIIIYGVEVERPSEFSTGLTPEIRNAVLEIAGLIMNEVSDFYSE